MPRNNYRLPNIIRGGRVSETSEEVFGALPHPSEDSVLKIEQLFELEELLSPGRSQETTASKRDGVLIVLQYH